MYYGRYIRYICTILNNSIKRGVDICRNKHQVRIQLAFQKSKHFYKFSFRSLLFQVSKSYLGLFVNCLSDLVSFKLFHVDRTYMDLQLIIGRDIDILFWNHGNIEFKAGVENILFENRNRCQFTADRNILTNHQANNDKANSTNQYFNKMQFTLANISRIKCLH